MRINKKRLHMILASKCMTVTDLRLAAGISSQTLAKIRNNSDYEPNTRTIGKIAQALGVTVEDLLVDEVTICG